jgi:hypothetical protein
MPAPGDLFHAATNLVGETRRLSPSAAHCGDAIEAKSMIPKSGHRFSEKIMLQQ